MQAKYNPAWYGLLASKGERVILLMDARQMSATGSLNRLNFLDSLGQCLFRWYKGKCCEFSYPSSGGKPELEEKKMPKLDFAHARRDGLISPFTTETMFFQTSYIEDAERYLSTNRGLAEVSLNLEGPSPMELAKPYILSYPTGRLVNTMITALKLEFDLWRAYKKLYGE